MNTKALGFGVAVLDGSVAAVAEDAINHLMPKDLKPLAGSFVGRGLIGAVAMAVGTIVVHSTVKLIVDIVATVQSVEDVTAEEETD